MTSPRCGEGGGGAGAGERGGDKQAHAVLGKCCCSLRSSVPGRGGARKDAVSLLLGPWRGWGQLEAAPALFDRRQREPGGGRGRGLQQQVVFKPGVKDRAEQCGSYFYQANRSPGDPH